MSSGERATRHEGRKRFRLIRDGTRLLLEEIKTGQFLRSEGQRLDAES